jgi:hypothetical protein
MGYPSAFACEGDPLHGGFPGDFDPYVHGDKDVIDVDDEHGVFSFDVSRPLGRRSWGRRLTRRLTCSTWRASRSSLSPSWSSKLDGV